MSAPTISYLAYESSQARLERINTRLCVVTAVALFTAIISMVHRKHK